MNLRIRERRLVMNPILLEAVVALMTVMGFCVMARRFDLREREREEAKKHV